MTCLRCASTLTLLSSMTMNELLKQLIKKCKMEAQEGLRQLIGALNGLAGIFRIQMKVCVVCMSCLECQIELVNDVLLLTHLYITHILYTFTYTPHTQHAYIHIHIFIYTYVHTTHIHSQCWMQWTDAVEMYRSAMSTWQEHMPELECDFTQRIHTLEGLAELLQAGHCPLSRAVSDSTLLKEVCACGVGQVYMYKSAQWSQIICRILYSGWQVL